MRTGISLSLAAAAVASTLALYWYSDGFLSKETRSCLAEHYDAVQSVLAFDGSYASCLVDSPDSNICDVAVSAAAVVLRYDAPEGGACAQALAKHRSDTFETTSRFIAKAKKTAQDFQKKNSEPRAPVSSPKASISSLKAPSTNLAQVFNATEHCPAVASFAIVAAKQRTDGVSLDRFLGIVQSVGLKATNDTDRFVAVLSGVIGVYAYSENLTPSNAYDKAYAFCQTADMPERVLQAITKYSARSK